jgi:hypothetical protein
MTQAITSRPEVILETETFTQIELNSEPVSPRTELTFADIAWVISAQRIVDYPEDFGMSRAAVRPLARQLAERREQLWASRN